MLRGLDIDGNGPPLGLNGVRITSAKSVKIYDSNKISDFSRTGVALEPIACETTKLLLSNTDILNGGGAGVSAAPSNTATAKATIRRTEVDDNVCGLVAAAHGLLTNFAVQCGYPRRDVGNLRERVGSTPSTARSMTTPATGCWPGGSPQRSGWAGNEVTGLLNVRGLNTIWVPGLELLSFGNNLITDNTTDGVLHRNDPVDSARSAASRNRVHRVEEELRSSCAERRLQVEQQPLALQPAGVAGEAAVGADHPMARDDHRDRVAAVGRADRAGEPGWPIRSASSP